MDVARFRDFLNDLGISLPTTLPPFEIQSNSGGTGMVTPPPGLSLDRSAIVIGGANIRDRSAATAAYSNYVLWQLANKTLASSPAQNQILYIGNLSFMLNGISAYLNASYWGHYPPRTALPPFRILLAIRQSVVNTFTDSLAASALKTIATDPREVI